MNLRTLTIDPRKIRLLDLNARVMTHGTYQRLVENIRRDGKLTSAPLLAVVGYYAEGDEIAHAEDGELVYEVLSGNHRVKAAIDAGLAEIVCLAIDEPLPKERRVALQLSHNSLAGEDDPATLKQLYESLDVNWRQYAGLDDKTLELLQDVKIDSLSERDLSFLTFTVILLPSELERVRTAYAEARKLIKADEVWLAHRGDYDRLLDSLDEVGSAHYVKNSATILMLWLDIVDRHRDDLAEGWYGKSSPKHKGYVPLSSLFGRTKIRADQAQVIKSTFEAMISRGEAKPGELAQTIAAWAQAATETPNCKAGDKGPRALPHDAASQPARGHGLGGKTPSYQDGEAGSSPEARSDATTDLFN